MKNCENLQAQEWRTVWVRISRCKNKELIGIELPGAIGQGRTARHKKESWLGKNRRVQLVGVERPGAVGQDKTAKHKNNKLFG